MIHSAYDASHWKQTQVPNGKLLFEHENGQFSIELTPQQGKILFVIKSGLSDIASGNHVYRDIETYVNDFIYSGQFTNYLIRR